jgi:hypothetical protein
MKYKSNLKIYNHLLKYTKSSSRELYEAGANLHGEQPQRYVSDSFKNCKKIGRENVQRFQSDDDGYKKNSTA